uniref:22.0 kDa class IV heat shock protein n=1 Tax=Elaeis guineensis var. tenera TaxID=51953 RepID=A0A6I9RUN6_ELAGV|nr:22.0 kDa class IV heat shock protein [Elaeis guineensis]
MEAMLGSRIYAEVDPYCQWVLGKEFDTLLVDVSGFKKEELKAQVDTLGNLKIHGERQIEGNQWCRFLKSFQLPKDCNARMIKINLDEGILYVVVPKPMAKNHLPQHSNGHAHNDGGVNETRENSLAEGAANNNVHVPETSKQGMENVAKGLNKYRQFITNAVVAIIVVVGLGIYIGYKLSCHKKGT